MLHVLSTVNVNHSQIIVCTKASFYCPKENTKEKKKKTCRDETRFKPTKYLFLCILLEKYVDGSIGWLCRGVRAVFVLLLTVSGFR